MKDESTITQQIKKSSIDGTVVMDSCNPPRKIVLRTPTLIDEFYIAQAMGSVDNQDCKWMARSLTWVAAIDDIVMTTPHSYNELIAALGRLKTEGLEAIGPAILKHKGLMDEEGRLLTEEEAIDTVKK